MKLTHDELIALAKDKSISENRKVDLQLLAGLLQKVIAYYEGQGKYNFSHLSNYDRDNAAFDAWQKIRQEIKEALRKYNALGTDNASGNASPRRYHVNMTYFKKSGKFYDEAWISVPGDMPLHQIWELVRRMRSEGRLEGLVEGAGREFMILVNVPGHPHEHPHIIV